MKTTKSILLGALTLLTVFATEMAWQSYWKARWIKVGRVRATDR